MPLKMVIDFGRADSGKVFDPSIFVRRKKYLQPNYRYRTPNNMD